jgi:hypothetical protein
MASGTYAVREGPMGTLDGRFSAIILNPSPSLRATDGNP